MALLEIQNLNFRYPEQEKPALNNVNLCINQGEFVVMCGSTGSGKTTLLKLLKKEIAPAGKLHGKILYDGFDLSTLTILQSASQIGYVFQNPALQIVTDQVYSELAFGLENLGVESGIIRRKVAEMASFFGINEWFRKKTNELSGGQKQILNLAGIMVMQPKILLLDEPTSQLDPIAAKEFIDILKRLNDELGLTIIIVEHRLEEIFPIADKIIIMNEGEVVAYDSPKVIRNYSFFPYISFPSSVKIFTGLLVNDEVPLTVKDGIRFLSKHFKNDIRRLPNRSNNQGLRPIIQIKDLWFRYEKNSPDIIQGLNLQINEGEILSIVGANGSGKTTLFKIIANTCKAYKGKVTVIKNIKMAFLPQNPQDLFVFFTVKDELEEMRKYSSVSSLEFDILLKGLVDEFKIDNLLQKHPYDLSGGEQQKVALVKILLLQPGVLFLDEPTKGFDHQLKVQLYNHLHKLKSQNITIVIVTHDIEFASRISDRVTMIFDGEILSVDSPNNFFANNNFYTTSANRISRHMYDNLITEEEVIALATLNGEICEK